MRLTSLITLGLIGAAAIATTHAGHAAVPVDVIQDWQKSAPDVVRFTVLSKDEKTTSQPYGTAPGGTFTSTIETLSVKIESVERTASKLQPGAVIVVRYLVRRYPPPGPPDGNLGTFLDVGESVTAYLKPAADSTFELACPIGCLSRR
jgi:hypothetical protein